jgi:hypothetical protein
MTGLPRTGSARGALHRAVARGVASQVQSGEQFVRTQLWSVLVAGLMFSKTQSMKQPSFIPQGAAQARKAAHVASARHASVSGQQFSATHAEHAQLHSDAGIAHAVPASSHGGVP